jgi:hypothetical protein
MRKSLGLSEIGARQIVKAGRKTMIVKLSLFEQQVLDALRSAHGGYPNFDQLCRITGLERRFVEWACYNLERRRGAGR